MFMKDIPFVISLLCTESYNWHYPREWNEEIRSQKLYNCQKEKVDDQGNNGSRTAEIPAFLIPEAFHYIIII